MHEFLVEHREPILALCAEKFSRVADGRGSPELERGLPIFYDELVTVLRASRNEPGGNGQGLHNPEAAARGKESLRLGFTVSQVVFG